MSELLTNNTSTPADYIVQKLLARPRANRRTRPINMPTAEEIDQKLQAEIASFETGKIPKEDEANETFALHLNEQQQCEEEGFIECGCCFGEFPFENMVQCSDGHLFCLTCLQSFANEVIFGSAIASGNFLCMTQGCTETFPYSQLKRCLNEEEIAKYQERLQEDCLAKVDLGPNLVHCPFCEFAAIIPEGNKVLECLNSKCQKVTCKECQEEWKDHFGLKCSEVEKKGRRNLRLSYEEKMTMAKVRKCPKCSCQFTKSDGCNKITCRCGHTMCYICRQPDIHYDHYCTHPRDPGYGCTECVACSLWTDSTEDDERAIKQLEEEAADCASAASAASSSKD